MENRPPFELKTTMNVFNIIQVLLNVYIAVFVSVFGVFSKTISKIVNWFWFSGKLLFLLAAWFQLEVSTDRFYSGYARKTPVGVCQLRLLPDQDLRPSGHCILRTTQKEQPHNFPAYISPCWNGSGYIHLCQIHGRKSLNSSGCSERLHSCHHVHLLLPHILQFRPKEFSLVEETHHPTPNGESFQYPSNKNIHLMRYFSKFQLQFLVLIIHFAHPLIRKPDCAHPRILLFIAMMQNVFMFLLFFDFYLKAYRRKKIKKESSD